MTNGNHGDNDEEEVPHINPVQVQKYLGGVDYPASRDDLVEHAQHQHAPDDVIQLLENLPDEQFETPADVTHAIGELE